MEDLLEQNLEWLQQCLNLDDAKVSKMIHRLPILLDYSVGDNLEPKPEWLQQRLNLDDAEVSKRFSDSLQLQCRGKS